MGQNSGRASYAIKIPNKGCGTLQKDGSQSNILVFQSDPVIQVFQNLENTIISDTFCFKIMQISPFSIGNLGCVAPSQLQSV